MSFATPDEILYEGKVEKLSTDMYFPHNHPQLIAQKQGWWFNSGNYRGFVALWELKDDKLYLHSTESPIEGDTVPPLYQKMTDEPIFADWYVGVIKIDFGERLQYEYGHRSVYEQSKQFFIQDGVVEDSFDLDYRAEYAWYAKCKEYKKLEHKRLISITSKERRIAMGYDESGVKLTKPEEINKITPWYRNKRKIIDELLNLSDFVLVGLALYGVVDIVRRLFF